MSEKPIDLSKPVMTKNGCEARVYTTRGENQSYPVVGEYFNAHNTWTAFSWRADGGSPYHLHLELINVPQQQTAWINVCRRPDVTELFVFIYPSRIEADVGATNMTRIACFEHTFTEGEGLE